MLTYLCRHQRMPDLAAARRFTEQVQRRKLYDRDPRHPPLLDKLGIKQFVAARLGPEWITPTVWHGTALPDAPSLGMPAILKARHGCNQYAVLREAPSARAWSALRGRAADWMAGPYGKWLDEWAYETIPRGLIAEPFLGRESSLPVDYKIYVFGGRATHVQVHLGRGEHHRWILHDREFRPLVPASDRPRPPRSLRAMLEAAEILSAGQDFIRVDFFEIGGRPRFCEFCLYPGSGLDRFAADWVDFELGGLWRDARGAAVEELDSLALPIGGGLRGRPVPAAPASPSGKTAISSR